MWTVSVDLKKGIEVMKIRIESSIFVKQINGGWIETAIENEWFHKVKYYCL